MIESLTNLLTTTQVKDMSSSWWSKFPCLLCLSGQY